MCEEYERYSNHRPYNPPLAYYYSYPCPFPARTLPSYAPPLPCRPLLLPLLNLPTPGTRYPRPLPPPPPKPSSFRTGLTNHATIRPSLPQTELAKHEVVARCAPPPHRSAKPINGLPNHSLVPATGFRITADVEVMCLLRQTWRARPRAQSPHREAFHGCARTVPGTLKLAIIRLR